MHALHFFSADNRGDLSGILSGMLHRSYDPQESYAPELRHPADPLHSPRNEKTWEMLRLGYPGGLSKCLRGRPPKVLCCLVDPKWHFPDFPWKNRYVEHGSSVSRPPQSWVGRASLHWLKSEWESHP